MSHLKINSILPPALHVVATPLGNPDDLSERAKYTLRHCDIILAEDTRITKQLLHYFDIDGRIISFNAHSESGKTAKALEAISCGQALALVVDAGTPGISDPGQFIVNQAFEMGISVIPIPGPSALTTALSVSGFPASQSLFVGFLPAKAGSRREALRESLRNKGTIIFYESPHRIRDLASQLDEIAVGRTILIAKELTKKFEYLVRVPAGQFSQWLDKNSERIRGEFVILVGPKHHVESFISLDVNYLLAVLARELPPSKAASLCAELTGVPKRILYQKLTVSSDQ